MASINSSMHSFRRSSFVQSAFRQLTTNRSARYCQQRRSFGKEMKDEYGSMTSDGDTFVASDFVLENGVPLPQAQLRYQTYGNLNERKDNVIVVCHALTGNASLHAWWGDLLGKNKVFDTEKYMIVCCNILGSCYGSTNPQSIDPTTGAAYGKKFPDISVKDTVRLQLKLLREELQISSIKAVVGGSFGGMQAMEYAIQAGSRAGDFFSEDGKNRLKTRSFRSDDSQNSTTQTKQPGSPYLRSVVPIACGAYHTAWQIAISEVQRQAIYADPMWKKDPFRATTGLEIARQMGMISYRTPQGYEKKFGRHLISENTPLYGSQALWQVKSYLEYQGLKFIDRFDPVTYVKLTEQMDSHNIARNRAQSVEEALGMIEIPMNVLGIDSDVLYPLSEQEKIVANVPKAELKIINSNDGHDGFLLEQDQVARHITNFLNTIK